ncbi:MAG: glycosyltransferase family 2 protein [Anaerolineales bacterium]|nr:glycosyltransferase family 2 protein [Anaerolineales bacterium]
MTVLFFACIGLIVYVYAGYPLLVTLLAKLRKPSQFVTPDTWPEVTLLIAAYNEEAVIANKLENSLALDYPAERLHILVAADGSSDQTADIVHRFEPRGVALSYEPARRGKMAAINRAFPNTRGDVIVFSDANNLYDAGAIKALIRPFSDPTVGATTGAKRILKGDGALGESEGLYWKYESFIKKQETRLGCCTAVAGEIIALRRAAFVTPPDYVINDDFYMGMRLTRQGYRVVYVPEAHSFEPVSLSAEDEVGRRARIVAGRYQAIALAHQLLPFKRPLIVWQIVSHKFLRPLVPLAMIGALLSNLWLLLFPVSGQSVLWQQVAFILQILFYAAAAIGSRLPKTHPLAKILYLPTFLVQSNGAALIGLYRFLTGRQSVLWQRAPRQLQQSK